MLTKSLASQVQTGTGYGKRKIRDKTIIKTVKEASNKHRENFGSNRDRDR